METIRDLDLDFAQDKVSSLGPGKIFEVISTMDKENFIEMGGSKTLMMVEAIGIERFTQLGSNKIVEALSVIDTDKQAERAISEEFAKGVIESLSAESIVKLGSIQAAEIVSFLDADAIIETSSDQIFAFAKVIVADPAAIQIVDSRSLAAIASKLNVEALDDIGTEGISELVSHVDAGDISELQPAIVGGLLEFLDADYLGDRILHFDEAEPMETFITTNYVAPPDAFLELMESEGVAGIFKGLFG